MAVIFVRFDDEVSAAPQDAADAQPQPPAVGANELAVSRGRPVEEEEPVRPGDHLAGPDVVPALVPRADQTPLGIDGAPCEIGQLVAAPPGDGEELPVSVAHRPVAEAADGARRQIGSGDLVFGHLVLQSSAV
jgi:hypothetical protein